MHSSLILLPFGRLLPELGRVWIGHPVQHIINKQAPRLVSEAKETVSPQMLASQFRPFERSASFEFAGNAPVAAVVQNVDVNVSFEVALNQQSTMFVNSRRQQPKRHFLFA